MTDIKWTRIATIIGIVTGLVTLAGTIYTNLDNWIVTSSQLKLTEQRIIKKVEDEAVKTRIVYIDEMIERKTKFEIALENETNAGKISQIIEEIKKLNDRIEKLRSE